MHIIRLIVAILLFNRASSSYFYMDDGKDCNNGYANALSLGVADFVKARSSPASTESAVGSTCRMTFKSESPSRPRLRFTFHNDVEWSWHCKNSPKSKLEVYDGNMETPSLLDTFNCKESMPDTVVYSLNRVMTIRLTRLSKQDVNFNFEFRIQTAEAAANKPVLTAGVLAAIGLSSSVVFLLVFFIMTWRLILYRRRQLELLYVNQETGDQTETAKPNISGQEGIVNPGYYPPEIEHSDVDPARHTQEGTLTGSRHVTGAPSESTNQPEMESICYDSPPPVDSSKNFLVRDDQDIGLVNPIYEAHNVPDIHVQSDGIELIQNKSEIEVAPPDEYTPTNINSHSLDVSNTDASDSADTCILPFDQINPNT